MAQRISAAERFWSKVNKDGPVPAERPTLGPCWVWTAFVSPYGYGQFGRGSRKDGLIQAHRWAWEQEKGVVPQGLELDHLCRNRTCVRVSHLELVTRIENVRRGKGHGSEKNCPQRHPYSKENTYINKHSNKHSSGPGYRRRCKTCTLAQNARSQAKERTQ